MIDQSTNNFFNYSNFHNSEDVGILSLVLITIRFLIQVSIMRNMQFLLLERLKIILLEKLNFQTLIIMIFIMAMIQTLTGTVGTM